MTYQTAYLKANYPVEFLAAAMQLDIDVTDKLAEFRQDAQRLGIPVDPPSINTSGVNFEVHDGRIGYALAAIKGVGRAAVEAVVEGARRHAVSRTSPAWRAGSTRASSTSAPWRISWRPAPWIVSRSTARGPAPPSSR